MPTIEFYYAPGACSLTAHILLHEVGAEFRAVPMRISAEGNAYPPSFQIINSKNQVPVLVMDGDVITEVPAIATAIADLAPDLHLMGRTKLETVRVYEWMNWLSVTLHGAAYGRLLGAARWSVSSEPEVLEAIKNMAKDMVKDCYNYIEKKLSGVHAVGEQFTAVDAYLFVFYRWGNQDAGFNMRESWPRYSALVENLVERHAVKATLEAECIDSTL